MPRPATGLNAVRRKRPDGSVDYDWYHRKTGNLIGRSRDGWTKEAAIERSTELDASPVKAGPPVGSFGQLCEFYLARPSFSQLKPKTQRDYRKLMGILRDQMGWNAIPATGITRTVVASLQMAYQDRPWQANALVRFLRILYNFAMRRVEMAGVVKNPADRPELFSTPPREQIWDQVRIQIFIEAAGDNWRLRLAIALLLYTVQRPADMLALEKPSVFRRDGRLWIRLKQAKTGELLDVPCHNTLADEIERAEQALRVERAISERRAAEKAAKAGVALLPPPEPSNLLLASPTGKRWSFRNFSRAWDRVRRRANWRIAREAMRAMGGLPPMRQLAEREKAKRKVLAAMLGDFQRRDLRRTGIVQLALVGATTPEIAALSGHRIDRVQRIIDTYLPRRGEVALGGIEKWERNEGRVLVLASQRRGNAR